GPVGGWGWDVRTWRSAKCHFPSVHANNSGTEFLILVEVSMHGDRTIGEDILPSLKRIPRTRLRACRVAVAQLLRLAKYLDPLVFSESNPFRRVEIDVALKHHGLKPASGRLVLSHWFNVGIAWLTTHNVQSVDE